MPSPPTESPAAPRPSSNPTSPAGTRATSSGLALSDLAFQFPDALRLRSAARRTSLGKRDTRRLQQAVQPPVFRERQRHHHEAREAEDDDNESHAPARSRRGRWRGRGRSSCCCIMTEHKGERLDGDATRRFADDTAAFQWPRLTCRRACVDRREVYRSPLDRAGSVVPRPAHFNTPRQPPVMNSLTPKLAERTLAAWRSLMPVASEIARAAPKTRRDARRCGSPPRGLRTSRSTVHANASLPRKHSMQPASFWRASGNVGSAARRHVRRRHRQPLRAARRAAQSRCVPADPAALRCEP
jgi:hypothetical protein